MRKSLALAALPAALVLPLTAGLAQASPSGVPAGTFHSRLAPVPHDPTADGGSQVDGAATITLHGRRITVDLHARGLTPGEPHLMHLHGTLGTNSTCPTLAMDTDGDGIISIAEGAPAYGTVQVSLTASGDTGPASGTDLVRFMTSNEDGVVDYHRTFKVPIDVAKQLTTLQVVVHGLDLPADADTSSTSSTFEVTTPVACGDIT